MRKIFCGHFFEHLGCAMHLYVFSLNLSAICKIVQTRKTLGVKDKFVEGEYDFLFKLF